VGAILPDTSFDIKNTAMYLVIPSIHAVMANTSWSSASNNSATHTIYLQNKSNVVPIGIDYKLVLICQKGSTYYYYETSGNVTAAMAPTVAFTAKTYTQLVSLLQGL
jgi:hypothetical protein